MNDGQPPQVQNPVRPGTNVDAPWYNPSEDRNKGFE